MAQYYLSYSYNHSLARLIFSAPAFAPSPSMRRHQEENEIHFIHFKMVRRGGGWGSRFHADSVFRSMFRSKLTAKSGTLPSGYRSRFERFQAMHRNRSESSVLFFFL